MIGVLWYAKAKDGKWHALVSFQQGIVRKHAQQPQQYEGRIVANGLGTLVILNITFEDSTEYQCSVFEGSTQLDSITKLVVAEPTIASVEKKVVDCEEGSHAKIVCIATSTPAPNFEWLWKNSSRPLLQGAKHEIVTSGNSSELTIKNCSFEDMDYYTCKASVGPFIGVADCFLGVMLLIHSKDHCPMTSYQTVKNEPIIICCPVYGFPQVDVTWELSNGSVIEKKTTTLTIIPMQEMDFGYYTCTAKNRFLDKVEGPFIITVLSALDDVTFDDNVLDGAIKWKAVPKTELYVLTLSAPELKRTVLLGDDNKTSLEIPYSSLYFKDPGNKPDPVTVKVEVLAIGNDTVIGKGGLPQVDIPKSDSTWTASGIPFSTLAILLAVVLNLQ